jgi:hypothetical protein
VVVVGVGPTHKAGEYRGGHQRWGDF